MRKLYLLPAIGILTFFNCAKSLSQNVGIGTSTPNSSALLHVDLSTSTTKGLLVTGTYNGASTIPDLGSGSRMMFYPGKAAFRAGYIDAGASSANWDNNNVGFFSTATGYNTKANGQFSTATGSATSASGYASFTMGEGSIANNNYGIAMGYHSFSSAPAAIAMGNQTIASGNSSTAMGLSTSASGIYSLAAGNQTVASGNTSTVFGYLCTASGYYSTAMGYSNSATAQASTALGEFSTASGEGSLAAGETAVASGDASIALGHGVNTNDKFGAFIFGDTDPTGEGTTFSGYTNEFVARFYNGYYFMTSGNVNRFGVTIPHNGNAWLSICNKNLKENFEPINGEDVLQKLAAINFTSWNYKQQDPKIYRHYGIMAQDFYNAFGHDKYGTIGNDTTVNPIDMIGIDMTAIQALEKRTKDLKNENKELKDQNNLLKEAIAALQDKFDQEQKIINELLESEKKKNK